MYTKQNGVNGRRPIAARSRTKSLGNGPNGKQTAHKRSPMNTTISQTAKFQRSLQKELTNSLKSTVPHKQKEFTSSKNSGLGIRSSVFRANRSFFGIERAKDWFNCEKSESLLLPFLKIDGIDSLRVALFLRSTRAIQSRWSSFKKSEEQWERFTLLS